MLLIMEVYKPKNISVHRKFMVQCISLNSIGEGLNQQPGSEGSWTVSPMGAGADPDRGCNLGWNRPEAVNSTGADTGKQPLRELAGARDLCTSRHESGTFKGVDLSQNPCKSPRQSGTF